MLGLYVLHHDVDEMLFVGSVIQDEEAIAALLAIYSVFGVGSRHSYPILVFPHFAINVLEKSGLEE